MVPRGEIPPGGVRRYRSQCDRTTGISRARGGAMGARHSWKSPLGECVDSPPFALARAGALAPEGGRILFDERAQRRIRAPGFRWKTCRIFRRHEFVKRRPHENGYTDSRRFETAGDARPGGTARISILALPRDANKGIRRLHPRYRKLRRRPEFRYQRAPFERVNALLESFADASRHGLGDGDRQPDGATADGTELRPTEKPL